jgi:hypothetical protein
MKKIQILPRFIRSAQTRFLSILITLLIGCLLPAAVQAEYENKNWYFSGFGTLGGTVTDEDIAEYRTDMTQFEGASSSTDWGLRSKLGVQLTYKSGDYWSFTGQALAKRRGDQDLDPDLEWLFASYHPASWLDLRAGRLVLPVFMLSDSRPVGFSQPFVEPPPLVYINASLSQFDGIQVINRLNTGSGVLSIQTSAGSADVELAVVGPPIKIEIDDILNINVTYEWGDWLWRLGTQRSDVNPEPNFVFPDFEDTFTGVGLHYDNGKLLLMTEYLERSTEPGFADANSHYVTLGWRFGKWLPSVTFAEYKLDSEVLSIENREATALTLRYDVANNMAIKAQWEEASPENTTWLNIYPEFLMGEKRNVYTLSLDFVF